MQRLGDLLKATYSTCQYWASSLQPFGFKPLTNEKFNQWHKEKQRNPNHLYTVMCSVLQSCSNLTEGWEDGADDMLSKAQVSLHMSVFTSGPCWTAAPGLGWPQIPFADWVWVFLKKGISYLTSAPLWDVFLNFLGFFSPHASSLSHNMSSLSSSHWCLSVFLWIYMAVPLITPTAWSSFIRILLKPFPRPGVCPRPGKLPVVKCLYLSISSFFKWKKSCLLCSSFLLKIPLCWTK